MTTAPTLVALTVTPRRTAYWIPGRRSSVTASDMERPIGKTLKCQALSAQWRQARRCVPRIIERAWSTAAIPRSDLVQIPNGYCVGWRADMASKP